MQHRNHNARVVLITAHPEYRDLEEAAPFGGVLFKVQDAGALVTGLHERLGLGTTWTAT
jgi:hypothetical protein